MGSFIAVLIAVAVGIIGFIVVKRRLSAKADRPIGGAGSGGVRNPVPPAKE